MKFKNILFPLDFSERSVSMAAEVELLARKFGSKVTVLHVFEIPATWYGSAEAPTINLNCFQEVFDAAKRSLESFTLNLPPEQVDKVICEGDPSWRIGTWARENPTDLIMMGTRGYGRIQGILLGSVVAKVIHDTPCAVWTDAHGPVKSGFRGDVSDVLCAVDIDEETIPLLQYADDIARMFSARLHLLHCVPEAETRPNKYFDFDLHRYLLEGARVELKKLQRQAGVEGEVLIKSGSIAKAIREMSLESKIGLVVTGRGESRHRLGRLRTHAYQIVHDAPCPVLSYCPAPQDRTSSSCNAEHLYRSAESEPPLIGSSRP